MARPARDEFDDPDRTGRRGAHRKSGGPRTQIGAVGLVVFLALLAVLLLIGVFRIVNTSTVDPEDKAAQDNPGVSSSAEPTPSETEAPAVEKTATVDVYNASGQTGVAKKFGDHIKGNGWKIGQLGNHRTADKTSSVQYSATEFEAQAKALADELGIEKVEQSADFQGDISVVVCSDISASELPAPSPADTP